MKQTIPSLRCARDEIEDALEIVCESHNLTLARVWIPYKIDNHDHESSLGDTKTEQLFGVKLAGYLFSSIRQYLDMFPLRIGNGLAGKTLQTYKTYFCKDVSELNDNRLLPLFLPSNSCLTICLRSI
uniref:NLP1-9 GAF domain-containing protein n=1 Tax=Tanacetum cinerariifolium TaxID=118510 RepID=A0A699HRK7_TANCI|nr:hypothetical protein [Tanacetum cinerariifolium]